MNKYLLKVMCIMLCFLLSACARTDKPEDTAVPATETPSTVGSEITTEEVTQAMLPSEEFTRKPNSAAVDSGEFVTVSSVDSKYVKQKTSSILYLDATAPYFSIDGIIHPTENGGQYYRLDATKISSYPQKPQTLSQQTAGVTIRFRTNADSFVLYAVMRNCSTSYMHVAPRGAYGFDVYTGTGTDRVYCGAAMQMMTNPVKVQEEIKLPGGYTEVMIDLPMYGGVSQVLIGLPKDAKIAEPLERTTDPVCFYGSSITQGCAASRPGTAYTSIVCRMLDADCINLGFSSGAYGEQSIAQYITGLDMSAFVCDYDHNASVTQLRETHYDFYKTVRDAKPDLPIILVSRPIFTGEPSSSDRERIEIIRQTYERAVAAGDKNIYLVLGSEFFPKGLPDTYSVDMTHPNDSGFHFMAMRLYDTIYTALAAVQGGAQ